MTDDLLAEFLDGVGRRGPSCTIATLALSDEQAAKLAAALEHPGIPGTRISDVLRGWGFHASADTVQRHRHRGEGGGCKCPK